MSGDGERRSFRAWLTQPEMLVAFSAILLSLCGLFISIYEASLVRREARASVWPHVETAASIHADDIQIWVRNTGLGPARIQTAALTHEGDLLDGWADLVERLEPDSSTRLTMSQSLISGRVLPAEAEREIIFEVTRGNDASGDLLGRLRGGILGGTVDVNICYCSVYDECRVSSLRDLVLRSRGVDPGPDADAAPTDCGHKDDSGI